MLKRKKIKFQAIEKEIGPIFNFKITKRLIKKIERKN